MREQRKPYHFTVTVTTRPRRPAERNGIDYIFVSERSFRRMIDGGEFMEWAEVYGNLYGVPEDQVARALEEGKDVLVKADVQGAATIRALVPDGVFIFLAPPSMEELANRLGLRMTESSQALRTRLRTAELEMEEAVKFDYRVINERGRLDDTVGQIDAIVAREKREARPRRIAL
jgi:guanylate kinase